MVRRKYLQLGRFGVCIFPPVGATGFEPATSTSRTKLHSDDCGVNCGAIDTVSESLHQCLHQIAELEERIAVDLIVGALCESLLKHTLSKIALGIAPEASANN